MPLFKRDSDYIAAGLKPPIHIPHPNSYQQTPTTHRHQWRTPRAGGAFIECQGPGFVHGIPYDHLNKRLVGTDAGGAPVFKDVVLSDKLPGYYDKPSVDTSK